MASYFFDKETGWVNRDGHPVMRVFRSAPGRGFYHGLSEEEVAALGGEVVELLNKTERRAA